ncbi:hypothetical protein CEUSTIGMA_g13664.t1 [Chlamydomonas eustigma]|uniref:Uncharacterized protein n=1 Tax=Chlamydomonas eustigma TaxID=1157962 RepID=A0A250XTK3_9CHLO|nr:hypothetical protein CEUSTIGMA_g13664.t1 [Chlamydomonas eustigma]|eukprot:GAX86252.1 hypothetical protein CEUSTIGMA_g13664.t1 [Chlamydomonas eustigma]
MEGGGEVDGPCGSAQKKVGRPKDGRPPLPPRPGQPTFSGSQAGGRNVDSQKMKAGWLEFFKTLQDANITNLSPLWVGLKELQDSLLPFFKESTSTPSQKYVIRSLASRLCSAGKLGTPDFILQQAMISQYASLKPHQFLTEEVPMRILYAFIFNYLYLNVAKLSQTLELAGEEENRRRELSSAMDSFYGALCEVAQNMSSLLQQAYDNNTQQELAWLQDSALHVMQVHERLKRVIDCKALYEAPIQNLDTAFEAFTTGGKVLQLASESLRTKMLPVTEEAVYLKSVQEASRIRVMEEIAAIYKSTDSVVNMSIPCHPHGWQARKDHEVFRGTSGTFRGDTSNATDQLLSHDPSIQAQSFDEVKRQVEEVLLKALETVLLAHVQGEKKVFLVWIEKTTEEPEQVEEGVGDNGPEIPADGWLAQLENMIMGEVPNTGDSERETPENSEDDKASHVPKTWDGLKAGVQGLFLCSAKELLPIDPGLLPMELLKDPSTLTSVKVRVLQKSKAANLGTNQLYHVAIEVGTGASPQETTVQALAQLYQENFLLLEDEQTQRPEIIVKLMDSDKDVKCTLDNCYNVSEEEEAVKGEGGVALAMGDVDAAHVEGGEQNSVECSAGGTSGTGPAVQCSLEEG